MAVNDASGSVGDSTKLSLGTDSASNTRGSTDINFNPSITFGTGDKQMDKFYFEEHTINNGSPLTLNIQDGSIKDLEGTALAFTKVKKISIAVATSQEAVTTTAWSLSGVFLTLNNLGTASYGELGAFAQTDVNNGFTVTITTADRVTITNADAAASLVVRVFIGGV